MFFTMAETVYRQRELARSVLMLDEAQIEYRRNLVEALELRFSAHKHNRLFLQPSLTLL